MSNPRVIHTNKPVTNWPATAVLSACALLFILGILYITLVVAMKTPNQMASVLSLPRPVEWRNFANAWTTINYPVKFFNTLIITAINLPFTLLTNSAVAYALTRNRKKGRFFNLMYYYFISAMFIPFQVLMLPLVKQASFFRLDNIIGISFLYIVFGLPMNTFLYCGYIRSLPEAIDEAATIDGLNPLQIFMRIIFPVMTPMHATVTILSVMWTWNDFLMPLLLLTKPDNQTLQLSQYVFQSQFSTDYNLAFASYILVLLPVLLLYIFCQRWIIAGVTSGSIKA
ncbi:MAG: carbohydrate ABC transporter permease [Spirochaetaceae bacterium]|jgi:raffinose/stachyose/melibiose transport system permease protein|nr:carbohydrate ABC transporter permease [Spirochaetaceae bacterium]